MARQKEVRLDHVAFGVRRLADAPGFLVGELGGVKVDGGPGTGYEGAQWSFARGERLEVIAPAEPAGGFLHRFIEARGPGLHHATFTVPDLDEACSRAEASGYEVVGRSDLIPSWKEAFLHPRQALGIVVQLAEHDPDAEGSWGAGWNGFPDCPAPAAPAARVAALRMAARDAGEARRQWEGVLLGRCTHRGPDLVFEWDHSPIRIVVGIDGAAPQGPQRLELRCRRRLELPAGEHPALGARFVQID